MLLPHIGNQCSIFLTYSDDDLKLRLQLTLSTKNKFLMNYSFKDIVALGHLEVQVGPGLVLTKGLSPLSAKQTFLMPAGPIHDKGSLCLIPWFLHPP